MEKLFYEIRPYFFAVIAVIMLMSHKYYSTSLTIWSSVLLLSSLYLIKRRLQHRVVGSTKSR